MCKGLDLRYMDFSSALLRGTQLQHTQLDHSNLHAANLEYANLQHAKLSNSTLQDANLQGHDLVLLQRISSLHGVGRGKHARVQP